MKSFTTRRFRAMYDPLPEDVRRQARRAYKLFRENPAHPGLNFKKVDQQNDDGDDFVWFWIGPHSEYDKLL